MMTSQDVIARLEQVSARLKQGQPVNGAELAREIDEVMVALRQEAVLEPADGLMTTGEAAAQLGIRSVNTIKRWVRQGLLEGFRRGGRVMVSRQSVVRLALSPALSEQWEKEETLASDLRPFDLGDDSIPPTGWHGRRPWERRDAETS